MQNKYLIIVNKTANHGHTKKLWPNIKAYLNRHNIQYSATATKYRKNAVLITEEYIKQANSNDILLVIGGDGTLNEVINGSKRITQRYPKLPTLPIGYVPTGTHNRFAKKHAVSLNWRKCITNILDHKDSINQIKIGYFNETIKNQRMYFLNDVGIGLNADLIGILHRSKVNWKIFRYFLTIFYLLYNLQFFTLEIYHPHKVKIYRSVFLANVTMSTSKDKNFNLIIIKRRNIFIMFYIFTKLFLNEPVKVKGIHYLKVNHIHLGIPTLEYGDADGEELGDRFYDFYFHTTHYPFI